MRLIDIEDFYNRDKYEVLIITKGEGRTVARMLDFPEVKAFTKADMVAMLDELKKEMNPIKESEYQIYGKEHWGFVGKCQDVIQQKIDALKSESEK